MIGYDDSEKDDPLAAARGVCSALIVTGCVILLGLILFLSFSSRAHAQAGAGGPIPNVVGSQYLATPNAVSDKMLVPFRVDNDGTLHVTATAGGGTQDVNLAQVAGATVKTGAGTASGAQRVDVAQDTTTIAGSAPGTAGTASANVVTVQGVASMTPVQVSQATASNLNATVVGTGTFATQSVPTAGTTGGATASFLQPTASDNHANIKNGAGTLYGAVGFNNSVTINYLRYYNAGTGFNGCNSATNLIAQFQVLPSGGFSIQLPVGAAFSTGLSICVTTGYATNDTTNATASAMSITTLYN